MRPHALLLILALSATAASAQLAWQGEIELARGAGLRGPWQQNESRYDFVDDPSVAIDEGGEIAVAWVDQARKAVLFQRFSNQGKALLLRPVDVSRQPRTFSWLPRIALRPGDSRRVALLWQEIVFSGGSHGGEILFAASEDGGRSFAPALNLSKSVPGDGKGRLNREHWHNGSLDLAAGPDANLYAAWTEYDGPLWFCRSTDGGRTFSPPQRIAGGAGQAPARAPALAVAPDGAVYLGWAEGENAKGDIQLARSTDAGRSFSAPRALAVTPGHSDSPKLAVDAKGTLHAAYAESSAGLFGPRRIHYLRSTDGGRTFEAPREVSGSGSYPHLAVDGKGRVLVLWEMPGDARERPRGLSLAVSSDGGGSFSAPRAVPGSVDPGGGANGSSQGLLMRKLAVNGGGGVAIVNSSLKEGSHSRAWLLRGQLR